MNGVEPADGAAGEHAVGGFLELLEEVGTGFFTGTRDPQDFAESLMAFCGDALDFLEIFVVVWGSGLLEGKLGEDGDSGEVASNFIVEIVGELGAYFMEDGLFLAEGTAAEGKGEEAACEGEESEGEEGDSAEAKRELGFDLGEVALLEEELLLKRGAFGPECEPFWEFE